MIKRNFLIVASIIFVLFSITYSCKKKEKPLTDVQKVAALKDVSVNYDNAGYNLSLPDGALSGKSFDQLRHEDSLKYTNPENYGVTMTSNFNADNTKENSHDAKFDGMDLIQTMDTIKSNPIKSSVGPFDIPMNSTVPVSTSTKINLKTHRRAGLYIFQQIVDGHDLATTFSPSLNYNIGVLNGSIPLPDIKQNIPTTASAETKEFLKGLILSEVFKVQ